MLCSKPTAVVLAVLCLPAVDAFLSLQPLSPSLRHTSAGSQILRSRTPRRASPRCALLVAMGPFDGWISAAKYRETCPPQSCVEQLLLDQVRKQDFDPTVLHWAHPATMVILVAPALAYAAYLGWKIRTSQNQDSTPSARMSGQDRSSAGRAHAILMSLAALLSIFGIQGGLGSMLLAGEPILESPHAASGFLFAACLGVQVSYPNFSTTLQPVVWKLACCCIYALHLIAPSLPDGRAGLRRRWATTSCCALHTHT
jgi:hypothetical protein